MTKRNLSLLALGLLLLCGCYSASEHRSRAEAGDVSSQIQVGMAYFYGAPPENRINYDLAFRYFNMAAKANEPIAQYHLGEIYEKGLGSTAPDYRLARQYYADSLPGIRQFKGPFDGDSRFVHGKMFYYGRGETQDVKSAGSYFQRAAKIGSYEAMLYLARFYSGEVKDSGFNLEPNKAKAFWEKASSKGYPAARYELALIMGKESPGYAKQLIEQAALSDYPPALISVAVRSGDPQMLHKAYLRAARMGYARAISELPVSEADVKKQFELLIAAATRGDQESMLRLAESYQRGNDPFRAIISYYLLDMVKGADPKSNLALQELDKQTGMTWVLIAEWDQYRTADALSLLNNRLNFFIQGYESKISGVRDNLNRYLLTSAQDCLLDVGYLRLLASKGNASSQLAGDIFKNIPKDKRDFNYYLQYAMLAGICGQGEIQLDATDRASKSANFVAMTAKYPVLNEYVKLMHANALVMLGRAPEAYEYLFANNPVDQAEENSVMMLNFVNKSWCDALRLDSEKLSASTRLSRVDIKEGANNPKLPLFDISFNRDSDKIPMLAEPELPGEGLDDLSKDMPVAAAVAPEPLKPLVLESAPEKTAEPILTNRVVFIEDEEII